MSQQQNEIASKPEIKELTQETDQLLTVATNYRVTTPAEYARAGDELKRIKATAKRLDEIRKSMTKPLDTAKRAILDFFREPEAKLQRAESGIKRAMLAYADEQERIRREEQRKAEEAARKQREKLEAQAAKAAAAGKIEKAEELEQRAACVVAPVIQREPPKVTGVATREVWRFEIVDASQVPREYTMPDEKKIGAVVRALKGDTNIPGVRVWAEKSLAAGSA